jgi:hypothetical protein
MLRTAGHVRCRSRLSRTDEFPALPSLTGQQEPLDLKGTTMSDVQERVQATKFRRLSRR